MILKMYKVNDGDNVINKSLIDPAIFEIVLKNDFNIVNPTLLISNFAGFDVRKFNYCTLEELDRCYFIDGITMMNGSVFRLECSCDVLESFKVGILGSTARFMRNIRTGDYFNAQISTSINKTVSVYESDKSFTGLPTMVLTTIGV